MSAVERFADAILEMVIAHCREGIVPWSIPDFDETELFYDSNMYFERAGQVYNPLCPASNAECRAIGDELDRRIGDGALVADLIAAAETEQRWVAELYGSEQRKREFLAAVVMVDPLPGMVTYATFLEAAAAGVAGRR